MGLMEPEEMQQIIPGWYVLYQPQAAGPWVDVGRLEVINDPNVPKGKIETWYLNLAASTSGGGLPPPAGGPGTEPRAIYAWPGSTGHTTESIRFVKSPTSLAQPVGIQSNKIVCVCSAPVIVGP